MSKKYLSLDKLAHYDELLKAKIANSDASTLQSAKDYTDEKLSAITSGNTEVAKAAEATHAVSADTATNATNANAATKATQDANGNVIDTTYETKSDASAKLQEAKNYADTAAATVKNDLLNGAGEAYDTLKELADLINDNQDAIGALETVATGKADAEHDHAIDDVTGLQTALNAKANQSDLTDHTGNTTVHITADERTKWNTASTTADEAKAAAETNTAAISANTSSISAHTTAISNLQTEMAGFTEITEAEIDALFAE